MMALNGEGLRYRLVHVVTIGATILGLLSSQPLVLSFTTNPWVGGVFDVDTTTSSRYWDRRSAMHPETSTNARIITTTTTVRRQYRTTSVLASSKKGSNSNSRPMNEFSRTLQPSRLLKTTRSSSGQQQQHTVSIVAEEAERNALAIRFTLSRIAHLSADLVLRSSSSSSSATAVVSAVEVEGTCHATVTQRCVRTNDDFEVNLEFPIYSIVHPVMSTLLLSSTDSDSNNDPSAKQLSKGKSTKSKSQTNSRQSLDEIQSLLESAIQRNNNNEDNNNSKSTTSQRQNNAQQYTSYNYNDDDVIMEDEAIYCVDDGVLDIGELVSQLFWLQLDPYPKKPGTNPIQRSITG